MHLPERQVNGHTLAEKCILNLFLGEHWLNLYHLYGTWLVSPFSRVDFYSNVFEPLYSTQDWTDVPFDCIALFYAVLAVGVLYADVQSTKKTAAKYHQLACSALAMARFEDVPTLRCIQTLVSPFLPTADFAQPFYLGYPRMANLGG